MAEVTEADLIRANKALRYQLGADDAARVAEAIAEERERARVPFLALLPTLEEQARLVSEDANFETDRPSFSDGRALGLHEAIDEISRAAEDVQ